MFRKKNLLAGKVGES